MATRFRVIEGGKAAQKPKAKVKRAGAKNLSIEKFECAPCTKKIGAPYGALIEMRVGSHVINGELVGGSIFWCCARCTAPHFFVKDIEITK